MQGCSVRRMVGAEGSALALVRVEVCRDEQVAALFDLHYVPLCRLAHLLLGDASRAEDIVQEAFMRTFAGWGRLRQPHRADVYLRRSVINLCRSGLRRRPVESRGNRLVHQRDESRTSAWDEGAAIALTVLQAVRRLPPRQRATVVLRYYLDLPEAEIAAVLGTTTGTVKSQLAKARVHLAGAIGER
jgi:RNA polymerase sigma-70 factor (sigma-E family)